MTTVQAPTKPTLQSWIVCMTASLFFLFIFIQINAFNSISSSLLTEFKVTPAQLGQLSSYYFLANVICLFPVGILLDYVSPKKVMLSALLLCTLGTYAFALSPTILLASLSRLAVGIGASFAFVSAMKIATRWFPYNRLAVASGFIVTMGMIGGMIAQTPMVWLVDLVGWRDAMLANASLGIVFLILIFFIVKDNPAHAKKEKARAFNMSDFINSLKSVLFNFRNWFAGLYASLINLPVFLLGAMWGILYLVQALNVGRTQAALTISMLYVGLIVGSPFFGWFSDMITRRKLPMYIGTFLSLFAILIIMYVPNLHLATLMFLFFLLGFASSAQILAYPLIAEINGQHVAGSALGLASVIILAGGFTQPIFGWLMSLSAGHTLITRTPVYTAASFHTAMLLLPVCFALSFFAVLFLKETHCENVS
jgi:MFS family permease